MQARWCLVRGGRPCVSTLALACVHGCTVEVRNVYFYGFYYLSRSKFSVLFSCDNSASLISFWKNYFWNSSDPTPFYVEPVNKRETLKAKRQTFATSSTHNETGNMSRKGFPFLFLDSLSSGHLKELEAIQWLRWELHILLSIQSLKSELHWIYFRDRCHIISLKLSAILSLGPNFKTVLWNIFA